jgi:hypothetical protein
MPDTGGDGVNTDAIEATILTAASGEAFHEAYSMVGALEARAKELKQLLKGVALEHVQANGAFEVGEIRYSASREKKVVCRSVKTAVSAILELGGVEALEQCLSTSALKHGATKTVLETLGSPEQFRNLFDESWDDKLEVRPVNKRFLKGTNHAD